MSCIKSLLFSVLLGLHTLTVFAELSTAPGTGDITEGWDGPGQGSATLNWYLGWDNFEPGCANAPLGVDNENGLTFTQVEQQVQAALATWETAADIRFNKVGDATLPGNGCISGSPNGNEFDCDGNEDTFQINIYWAAQEHCHDLEPWFFDGRWNPSNNNPATNGFVFAHAWGPYDVLGGWLPVFGGNIHLDADEFWVTSNPSNFEGQVNVTDTSAFVDIQTEVLHELGHSLGLAHSNLGGNSSTSTQSVMVPTKWNLLRRDLFAYDIAELQRIYRAPRQHPGIVLVFDLSGSMNWGFDGTNPAVPPEQRLTLAKNAVQPLLALLNAHGQEYVEFAITDFRSQGNACEGHTHSGFTLVSDAAISGATSLISNLSAQGGTPLLAGLEHAAGLFKDQDRRAIVLLSDGYHNCPDSVSANDQAVSNTIAQLNNNNVLVYPIGFGRPEDFDHALLTRLAADTQGDFHPVTGPNFNAANWDATTALQNAYKAILVDTLGLDVALDPLVTIDANQTLSYDVAVTPGDDNISFFVSWAGVNGKLLDVRVLASDGVPVPAQAGGVKTQAGDTYRLITVSRAFLSQAGKVTDTPWKLEVRAGDLAGNAQEKFQYSVLMNSSVQLRPHMTRDGVVTGQPLTLQAAVVENNRPLTGLTDVYVTVTRPDEGLGNWLSRDKTDIKTIQAALRDYPESNLPLHGLKTLYIKQIKGVSLPGQVQADRIRLYDDGTHSDKKAYDGYYTNTYAQTNVPGAYTLYFEAQGKTLKQHPFRREAREQITLRQQVTAENTDIVITPVAVASFTHQIVVTPRDSVGNFLGPGWRDRIAMTVNGVAPASELIDDLDGSYRQYVALEPGTTNIVVRVGDTDMAVQTAVLPAEGGIASWCNVLLVLVVVLLLILLRRRRA